MSDNRFSLRKRMGVDGLDGAIYVAPHELHNEVQIILPEGYFGDKVAWPAYIDVPDFTVIAGNDWCQCEHICHAQKNPKYHGEHFVGETTPIKTPWGTYHVCENCKNDCLAEYRDYTGEQDTSGIAADDDPTLRPGVIKCEGCGEPTLYHEPREVLPPGKPDAEVKIMDLCEACVEVAEGADPVTGSWGAASAEYVIADRVQGIQK